MPHLAVRDTAADRQALARQPNQPLPTQAVQLLPSGSRFQTCWFLHLQLGRRQEAVQEQFFSHPVGGGFCMPWTSNTLVASTDTVSAVTADSANEVGPLDIFSSKPTPELRGSPVEAYFGLLLSRRTQPLPPSTHTVLYSPCI